MISTESSETLIKVKDLSFSYPLHHYQHRGLRDLFVSLIAHPIEFFTKPAENFTLLNGINFELKEGERLGILGTNGSGKTSLCRCLAGMLRPDSGSVDLSADVRAVFEIGAGVMPELTGRENAYLLARLFSPQEKDLTLFVEEALVFSELGHFIDVPFHSYSKGMQVRLLLSLISALPSDVLILDEVFDGADIFFQEKVAKRMSTFIHKARATVFVSHSLELVQEICNKVMVLHQGRIAYLGEVEKGIETYLTVAAYAREQTKDRSQEPRRG